MTRDPWSAGGRRALLAVGATLALAVAACGSSATTAPTSGPDGSVAPVVTAAPDETTGAGGATTAPAGDGSAAFTAASTALDALDSYAYSVDIKSEGGTQGTTNTRMSGVVFNSPEEASLLTMAELDESDAVTSSSSFLIIGDEAWTTEAVEIDDATEWQSIPAAQAGMLIQSFAAFRPEQMFGVYFAGFGGQFAAVGTETKNGVETTHYEGDESLGTILGGIVGVQGTWSSDAWIATDGGYLVHSEASAEGASGGTDGSFSIVVDIRDINSANRLVAP